MKIEERMFMKAKNVRKALGVVRGMPTRLLIIRIRN